MAKWKPIDWCVDAKGCHICTSHAVDQRGYAKVYHSRRVRLLHRVIFEQTYGPIPPGAEVCHSCDTPSCINPEHLFLGTHADNMADMIHKGRARHPPQRGEANGMVRLTAAIVLAIREDAARTSQRVLARRYGVNQHTIWSVLHGRTWAQVASESER